MLHRDGTFSSLGHATTGEHLCDRTRRTLAANYRCGWGEKQPSSSGGSNKEVFDTRVYAVYRALGILDQCQDTGRTYTLFVDSTAAIVWMGETH